MATTLRAESKTNIPVVKRPILRLTHLPSAPIVPKVGRSVSVVLPQPGNLITHPITGSTTFGYVPPLPFLTGVENHLPVVLEHGRQSQHGTGLGAAHSWGGHQRDIEALGAKSAEDTAMLVARVIAEGTILYFEPFFTRQTRLVAYRPGVGTVVLGFSKWGYRRRWKVITAHGGAGYRGDPIGQIATSCLLAPRC
ncbi:hypothetical protein [Pseudotabrizicola alkalilacus]|uniref:hypothetical protein n=1 Tax=Pseudotabrizicola alkalilacus TaxID=2305252 RepID=UPI000E4FCE69|nr:hypothetical protein [Pseudotabrizicola alkalilacus]